MSIIPATIAATSTVLFSLFGNIGEIASNNFYYLFKSSVSKPENSVAPTEPIYTIAEPGHHSGAGPVKGSRAHELEILGQANKKNGQLLSELEKQLYANDDNPRIHILEPKQKELADRYSCELFSAYIDRYRPYGIDETNAVLWKEPGTDLGATPGLGEKTPASAMAIPDLDKWSAHAEVVKGGAWAMLNIPDCQAAIHEIMHIEEYPPNSYKASEVLTVMRDLINLDAIRKQILGSPIEKEEPYRKSLKITSSPQGFAKTCSIPLGKFINFYRDLEKRKNNLAEAIASPESIDLLTGCQSGFHEYESLVKSVQGGRKFEAALNYVKEYIESKDLEFQKSAFLLLKELVKQGQSEEFAMEVVIKSGLNVGIEDEVLDLFHELLIRGKQPPEMTKHVIDKIENGDIIDALIIMQELINYGNFDEVFAIETGIKYSYYGTYARDLLDKLIRKDKGLASAIEYVNANIGSEDEIERTSARKLLIQLVEYGKIEDSFAIPLAISFLEAYASRDTALSIFEALFKNGKGIDSAIEFVTKNIDNNKWTVKESAYDLLRLLVEHGQCAERAIRAVTANLGTEDPSVGYVLFKLIQTMVPKGVGTEILLKYAQENLDGPRHDTALKLLKELAKGQKANS